MFPKINIRKLAVCLSCMAMPALGYAQSASTGIDVGPGGSGAWGAASGQYQLVETGAHVGPNGSLARGLAVGAGPGGLALSHSIGVNGGGAGAGHNFNLSIGPGGAHTSGGSVVTRGGNTRVVAGGQTELGQPFGPPTGGSSVGGWGHSTRAHTHARSTPAFPRPPMSPWGGSSFNRMRAAPRW